MTGGSGSRPPAAGPATEAPPPRDAGNRYSITFVCTGNICRSPMAEVILRALVAERGLEDSVAVTSSGTGGWHVGDGADPRTIAALARHGFDGTAHRAQRFDARVFGDHDLVVAMDRTHERDLRALAMSDEDRARIILLRDFDPVLGDEVPDPYYGGAGEFEEVFHMVERSARSLLDAVQRRLSVRSP